MQTGFITLHTHTGHRETFKIDTVALIPDFMTKQRGTCNISRGLEPKGKGAAEMKSKDSVTVNSGNENTIDPKSGM